MSDLLVDNKKIYHAELQFLKIFEWLSKITLFLFFIGFFQNKPSLFVEFNFIVKLVLALFLIYRFNSYRKTKIEFTELDRKVCYSAGTYILMISFIDLIDHYSNELRAKILPWTTPLVNRIKQTLHLS